MITNNWGGTPLTFHDHTQAGTDTAGVQRHVADLIEEALRAFADNRRAVSYLEAAAVENRRGRLAAAGALIFAATKC